MRKINLPDSDVPIRVDCTGQLDGPRAGDEKGVPWHYEISLKQADGSYSRVADIRFEKPWQPVNPNDPKPPPVGITDEALLAVLVDRIGFLGGGNISIENVRVKLKEAMWWLQDRVIS